MTFPFASDGALTANVVGSSRAPSPASCFGVAACLGMAAVVVAVPAHGRLHQLALAALATGFATARRIGSAGRTDLLVPGRTRRRPSAATIVVFCPRCVLRSRSASPFPRGATDRPGDVPPIQVPKIGPRIGTDWGAGRP